MADRLNITNLDFLEDNPAPLSAIEWMAYSDPLRDELLLSAEDTTSNRVLLERYALAVLFFATNGVSWTKNYNFLSDTYVCLWNNGFPQEQPSGQGVYCNEGGQVFFIRISTSFNIDRNFAFVCVLPMTSLVQLTYSFQCFQKL